MNQLATAIHSAVSKRTFILELRLKITPESDDPHDLAVATVSLLNEFNQWIADGCATQQVGSFSNEYGVVEYKMLGFTEDAPGRVN